MKVALYTRCSSDIQENLDRSIPAQLKALKEYVNKKGYAVYKEYSEPGESAYKDDENRDKFHQMISDAREGKFEAVLVHRYNRFYRDQYKSMSYKKILKDCGVRVISISEEFDSDTIQGFMLERMIEMMDQVQSMQNAWETFKGMKENAMQGYKNGGVVPYGYKRIQIPVDINRPNPRYKIKWEIDQEKAEVIKKIFDYRLKGYSAKKIAGLLNSERIKSPRGDWWCHTTVRYFLMRADVYAGDYIWNLWEKKRAGQKFKDKKDWIVVKDAHPPIISREVAEKTRIPIGAGKGKFTHTPIHKSRFLLTGKNIFGKPFFTCTNCGGNMVGYHMNASKKLNYKKYFKYICSNYWRKGKVACDKHVYLEKDWLEAEIIKEISRRYSSAEAVNEVIRKLGEAKAEGQNQVELEIKSINKEISNTKVKINKLFEAIYSGVDKNITVPESKKLSERIKFLEARKDELLRDKKFADKINISDIKKFFSSFDNVIAQGDYESQSNILKCYIHRILFNPEKEEVTLEFFELPKSNVITRTFGGARDRI